MERSFGTYLEGNAAESMLATGEWSAAADLHRGRGHAGSAIEPPHPRRPAARVAAPVAGRAGPGRRGAGASTAALALSGADQPMPQFVAQLMRIDGEFAVMTGRARARVEPTSEAFARAPGARRPAADAGPWSPWARRRQRRWTRGLPEGRSDVVREVMSELGRPPCRRCGAGWPRRSSRTRGRTGRATLGVLQRYVVPGAPGARTPSSGWPGTCRRLVTAPGLRALLDEALPASRELGARLVTNRLSVLAQRVGVAQAQGGGTATPLAALTARELEVLRLVGAGRSNKEIGERSSSSAPRRRACTSPTSWPSSGCPGAARRRRSRIATALTQVP